MSKTLSPEARERKRQRDAEYRARKAVTKGIGDILAGTATADEVLSDPDVQAVIEPEPYTEAALTEAIVEAFVAEDESLGPVVNEDGTPSDVTLAMFGLPAGVAEDDEDIEGFRIERQAEFDEFVSTIHDLQPGDAVTTPVGGMPAVLVRVNQRNDWEYLFTGDGLTARRNQVCPHKTAQADPATWTYFEALKTAYAQYSQAHGWVHSAPTCRRITQVG